MKKCSNENCRWEWPDDAEACSVCGGNTFIDPASTPNPKQEELPSCCVNPNCANSIIFNGTKYCSECGTKLQSVSWNSWEQKVLTPTLEAHFTETVIDPSTLVTSGVRFGFTEDEVERHLDTVLERLTNVTRQQMHTWMQTAVLSVDKDEDIQKLRKDAILSARKSKISEIYARRVLDELVPPVTHVSVSSPPEQSADNRKSVIEAESQLSATSKAQEVIPISDYSSTDSGRNSAKAFYRHLVSGGAVTNNLVYLSSEKSASKQGLKDREEFLREASNKQGTFILFTDLDKGWVLPNPSLQFWPEALASLFPDLTEDQYHNFKQYIEPVPVTRAGKGRWKVTGRENGSAHASPRYATDPESKTAGTNETAVTLPISAANYLETMQSIGEVVRHDTMRDLLVSGPEGKGELLLIRDYSAAKNAESLFVIPRITRFRSSETFDSLYKKYYDCARPLAGDVWIIAPAVVSKVDLGWQLYEKGVLEVGKPLGKARMTPPPGAEGIPAPQRIKEESVGASDFAPATKRWRIFMAVIGTFLLAIFIFWLLYAPTSGPLANGNINLGPATENNNPASPAPSASRSSDEEFKLLRQKRTAATPSVRREIMAAFSDAEKKYPRDYRLPYERAKLSIKGIISDQEAFSALFLSAENAIDSGDGQKVLDDLLADKEGDFYKLSRGHNEWELLIRALTTKDRAVLKR